MRLGWTEILVVLGVILIFFGGKRLPDLGRSLGKALRGFKDGVDGKDAAEDTAAAALAAKAEDGTSAGNAASSPASPAGAADKNTPASGGRP